MTYEDINYDAADGVLWLTIDRQESGNKFRRQTTLELADALRRFRSTRELGAAVITGAGEKFFCIGGEHDPIETHDYSEVLPIVDVYELIDVTPKPVIAAVNGFAVGGGQVLQTVCDISVAAENAIFRQVGPMVGSFDAGYGTWHLEDTVGRKRAREMWYFNRKYTSQQALAMGLVNEVVPQEQLRERVDELARELLQRGPGAIAGLKSAFSGRHAGVAGQARLAHDQLLTRYLTSQEAHEMSLAFGERRQPAREHFHR
jgi:naphthoate synthase